MLAATEKELTRISKQVGRRTKTPPTADESGLKVGAGGNRRRVAKHVEWTNEDGLLPLTRRAA